MRFSNFIKCFSIILSLAFIAFNSEAQTTKKPAPRVVMMLAPTVIPNLHEAIADIKPKVHIPVLFPIIVPTTEPHQKYYLSSLTDPDGNRYSISIDQTEKCQGAKYCSLGNMMGALGQRPQIYNAPNGKTLTEKVKLANNQEGFFTPSHAEADYWPAMVEWRMNNILYHLSWKLNDTKKEKKILVNLANTAIKQGAR